jgi:hypothetical protein
MQPLQIKMRSIEEAFQSITFKIKLLEIHHKRLYFS